MLYELTPSLPFHFYIAHGLTLRAYYRKDSFYMHYKIFYLICQKNIFKYF